MPTHTASFDNLPDSAFIREAQLVQSEKHPNAPLPFTHTTLWRKVAAGEFPRPVKLSAKVTAWRVAEVKAWMNARHAADGRASDAGATSAGRATSRLPQRQPPTEVPPAPRDAEVLRGRSTVTQAQEQRIVAALRAGPKTTDELRQIGCYQVSARVCRLRQRGYQIETELFDGYAADGHSHARLGRYRLVAEPLRTVVKAGECS